MNRYLLSLMVVLVFTGCGDDGLTEVSGAVSYAGQPISQGRIRFEPIDGRGPTAEALIRDGHYSVPISPGEKRVAIWGTREIGERRNLLAGPEARPIIVRENYIPAEYNDETVLQKTIRPDDDSLDLNLPAAR